MNRKSAQKGAEAKGFLRGVTCKKPAYLQTYPQFSMVVADVLIRSAYLYTSRRWPILITKTTKRPSSIVYSTR